MDTTRILASIQEEITKLLMARELLTASGITAKEAKRRGRPAGPMKGITTVAVKRSGRTMSEEGRARIAFAQKKRWAAQKKADKSAKPVATKSVPGPENAESLHLI